jgi:L-threonylcarbamoyladenylate synthase
MRLLASLETTLSRCRLSGDNSNMTEVLKIADVELSLLVEKCAQILKSGGLVIVPTDTVYGLAAATGDAAAVGRVFEVKGRDAEKSLVVMVSGREMAAELAAPEERDSLLKLGSLWPGPLTLVVKAGNVPMRRYVAPPSDTLGIRVPASPFMLLLLELTGPLAVTSANFTGAKAPGSFKEVDPDLLAMVDLAVDGGDCGSGKPSTVAQLNGVGVEIIRRGEIGEAELHRAMGID